MKTLELKRFYSQEITLGYLNTEAGLFFMGEPPWKDNQEFISCIPADLYEYHLNEDGILEAMNTSPRSDIQIHIGNKASETKGCQLIGLGVGRFGDELGVTHSGVAFDKFMTHFRSGFQLRITEDFTLD